MRFVISAGRRIGSQLGFPSVGISMNELIQDIEQDQVQSFRSAENTLMFNIAPVCPFKISI
jgi:hypothetical protein